MLRPRRRRASPECDPECKRKETPPLPDIRHVPVGETASGEAHGVRIIISRTASFITAALNFSISYKGTLDED